MDPNFSVLFPGAFLLLGLIVIWGAWGLGWQSRTWALARRFPQSVAIGVIRSRELNQAASAYVARGEWMDGPGAFPLAFTIVIGRDGVSFWKTRNSVIVEIPWADLGGVTFLRISQPPRNFRGLTFSVLSDGSRIELPVIPIGRGPFGQFVQTKLIIEAVCRRAESWRLVAETGERHGE